MPELVVVPASDAIPLPEAWSFEEGAAMPIVYATAYAGLPPVRLAACWGATAGAGGRRWRRHRGDADREEGGRGGVRHGVGREARGGARLRRRPPHRLQDEGLRRGGASHHRREKAPRPRARRDRRTELQEGLPAAAPPGAAGDARCLGRDGGRAAQTP